MEFEANAASAANLISDQPNTLKILVAYTNINKEKIHKAAKEKSNSWLYLLKVVMFPKNNDNWR